MLKLPRLIRGEMNKIFMRPILYVLTLVLVFALVLSVTIFDPTERTDIQINNYDKCKTYSDVMAAFNSPSSTNLKGKAVANDYIAKSNQILLDYENISSNSTKEALSNGLKTVKSYFDTYRTEINGGVSTPTTLESLRQNIILNLNTVKKDYENYVSASETNARFIIKDSTNIAISTNLEKFYLTINATNIDTTSINTHRQIANSIISADYITKLTAYFDLIEDIKFTNEAIATYKGYVQKSQNFMNEIQTKMNDLMLTENDENVDALINYAKSYYLVGLNAYNLTKNIVYYLPVENYNDSEINTYYRYNGVYGYQLREEISKEIFYVETKQTPLNLANTFSSSVTSNATVNAFDFVYFGLEIFGFIIIVFAVILGAGMIAGEYNSGTLKLLVVRPYSRHKIILSKIISTMLISTIFVIFGTVILFLIGLFMFGADFTPVLAVFNSTHAFTISPVLLLLIYLATLLFKILIYTLFAVAISVLFKSNVAAVTISIMVYFFSTVFNALFQSAYWYTFWPFCNLDLFKYFGGSFIVSANGNNILSGLVSSSILYNGSFFFSLGIALLIGVICAVVSHVVFAKRDIK